MRASLAGHVITTRRDAFTRAGAQPIRGLPHFQHGQKVKIGGQIVARHERSALARRRRKVSAFLQ
jgi:hypothetical protein